MRRLVPLCCAIGLLLGCPADSGPAVPIPSIDTTGMERMVAEVIGQARTAVVEAPQSGPAWGTYGMVLDVHDITREARACYTQAAALDGADPRWPYLNATLLDQAGAAADEVVALFERASELAPNVPAISVRLGDALLKRGRTEEAVAAFRRAVAQAPQLAIAHRRLGEALLSAGDVEAAVEALEASDRLHPGSSSVHSALARAYMRVGRVDDAERSRTEAGRGGADALLDDPIRATVSSYGRGLEHFRGRGMAAMRQGVWEQAIRDFEIVVRERPENARIMSRLAYCRQRNGDLPGAYRDFKRALKIDESLQFARVGLGTMLVGTNRVDESLEHLEKALEVEPENVRALIALATVLGRKDRLAESLDAFERAERIEPLTNPVHLTNWGITYLRLSRPEDAIARFVAAIEANAQLPSPVFQLGRAYEALGRFEEARAEYERVLELDPTHAGAAARLKEME